MVARYSGLSSALVILVTILFLATILSPVLAQPGPQPLDDERVPYVVQQGESMKPQVTPYYVKTQSGAARIAGTLSPVALQVNETPAEITAPGQAIPRFLITIVGEFSMQISQMKGLRVLGVHHASVWAKANEVVQNANFRFRFQWNGATQGGEMRTDTATLDQAPREFTVGNPPTFTEPLDFLPGHTMSIEILYQSSSRYLFGPNPGCVVLANSLAYATRIELNCIPLEANVSAAGFVDEHLHVNGKIWDSADIDHKNQLKVNLDIIPGSGGTVRPSTIEQMNFNVKEAEIMINWSWDWSKNTVADGLFEFRIDVSYGVIDHNYTNSSFIELKFPKEKKKDSPISSTQVMIIVIVAAVMIAVVLFIARRGRTGDYYDEYYPRRGAPARPAPAKKRKPTRAERKAAKRAAPPPEPKRTPMPGRRPDGRGPPPKRPPGSPPRGPPRGPPRNGPARAPNGAPRGAPKGAPRGPPNGAKRGPPNGAPRGPPRGPPRRPPAGNSRPRRR
jgi:hypothetical protein